MERKQIFRILRENLLTYGIEFADREAFKLFEEFSKHYGDELAYVYTMANIASRYKKPPLIDLDVIPDGDRVLEALKDRIKPANYSPYLELINAGRFLCAAEYAYEKGAVLLVRGDNAYLLNLADIPEP